MAVHPAILRRRINGLGWADKTGRAEYAWDFTNNQARWNSASVGALANTPNWTFTRASTAYYTNSAGVLIPFGSGVLRTGDRGALIEGAGTNLCLQSQTFDNATWATIIGGTVTANAGAAPDGTTTADRFAFSAQFSTRAQGVTTADSTTYTFSFYAKRESGNTALHIYHNNSATGNTTAFTITDSWARYSVTVLGRSGGGFVEFGVQDRNAAGHGSILVWGAQLEATAYASSYIPTTTASATRAADSLTVTGVTGLDYPLSLYAEYEKTAHTGGSADAILALDPSANTDETFIYGQGSGVQTLYVETGSTLQAAVAAGAAPAIGAVTKFAGRVLANDFHAARDGTLAAAPDTSGTVPANAPTVIRFGSRSGGGSHAYAYLRRAAIYASAKTGAQLQAMTT